MSKEQTKCCMGGCGNVNCEHCGMAKKLERACNPSVKCRPPYNKCYSVKSEWNWEEAFADEFLLIDTGPDGDGYDARLPRWDESFTNQVSDSDWDKDWGQIEMVKNFISKVHQEAYNLCLKEAEVSVPYTTASSAFEEGSAKTEKFCVEMIETLISGQEKLCKEYGCHPYGHCPHKDKIEVLGELKDSISTNTPKK